MLPVLTAEQEALIAMMRQYDANILDGLWHGKIFDRDGDPIDYATMCALKLDHDYVVVRKTTVGQTDVSSIWLGIDQAVFADSPLIFETMTFGFGPHYQVRASTVMECLADHEEIVERLKKQDPPGSKPLQEEG